jgi:hypothetical protein
MCKINNVELAKRMGFKTVNEMFKAMGYSNHKLADLKGSTEEEKRVKQGRKVNELIVNYYGLDAMELVDAIEAYKSSEIG